MKARRQKVTQQKTYQERDTKMALVQDTSLAEKDFFLIIWMTKLINELRGKESTTISHWRKWGGHLDAGK